MKFDDDFWDWFGDSKVVDNNGDPLVVYHATRKNFKTFKTPAWFTTNVDEAMEYMRDGGGNKVVKAYLRIENPCIVYDEDEIANKPYDPRYMASVRKKGCDGLVADLSHYDATYFVIMYPVQAKIVGVLK